MASRRQRNWAWQWYTREELGIQCKVCHKIFNSPWIMPAMKVHLRNDHQKFNEEDERKWIERTEESFSIWKYFTKQENYSAKCKICATLIQHAYNTSNVQSHLTRIHRDVIAKERQKVVKNISSRHFVIDENTDKAECKRCKKKFTIFFGIEYLRNHAYQHAMENITSHTNMGRNTIDMVQQSTSEENNANTSSYQAGTHSKAAENLEGEQSSISANNDDHIPTAMKIHSKDVCNTDNEKRNEMEWIEQKEESHSTWKYFTKEENYSAKCQICNIVIPNAYFLFTILGHLKTKHIEKIAKEKQEIMENTCLLRHFVIDVETEEVMCIHCSKVLSIFLGSENLSVHIFQHEMENITSHTIMGRNTIDMIQQSTSVENNADTSSYQAGIQKPRKI